MLEQHVLEAEPTVAEEYGITHAPAIVVRTVEKDYGIRYLGVLRVSSSHRWLGQLRMSVRATLRCRLTAVWRWQPCAPLCIFGYL